MSFATGGVLGAIGGAGNDWGTATIRLQEIRRQQDALRKQQELDALRVQIEQQRASDSHDKSQWEMSPERLEEQKREQARQHLAKLEEIDAQQAGKVAVKEQRVPWNDPSLEGASTPDGKPLTPEQGANYTVVFYHDGSKVATRSGQTAGQVTAAAKQQIMIDQYAAFKGIPKDQAAQELLVNQGAQMNEKFIKAHLENEQIKNNIAVKNADLVIKRNRLTLEQSRDALAKSGAARAVVNALESEVRSIEAKGTATVTGMSHEELLQATAKAQGVDLQSLRGLMAGGPQQPTPQFNQPLPTTSGQPKGHNDPLGVR